MKQTIQSCQNCHKDFTIEPEDFTFYERIQVPAPTWCSACRMQRRMIWRNERNLYHRNCILCGKAVISMYSPEAPFVIYCKECWWSDKWEPVRYGRELDFSKSFLEQFSDLLRIVPRVNLILVNTTGSDYCNYIADGKNSYLCFGSIHVEDCLYGSPYESKNVVDSFLTRESELCYECIDCEKLYESSYCQDCSGSSGLILCYDCQGCNDCIGCVGLRQKQYYVLNKPYTKEQYKDFKEKLNNANSLFEELGDKFVNNKIRYIRKYSRILHSTDVSGNYIINSKNTHFAFGVKEAEDSKYIAQLIDVRDTYDTNYCEHLELGYEHIGNFGNHHVNFCNTCGESQDVLYSDFCIGCSNLFGCISLRNKHYCILNKQYTKEEYEVLVPKIIQHMNEMPYVDKKGRIYRYGEFFPPDLSPFAYNETVAQEYFTLSEAEAKSMGFRWKQPEERHYQVTIKSADLPNQIKDISDSITNQVIECAHKGECNEQCTQAFKIIPQELQFYRKMNLPLPRLCPNCRHYQRLKQRNPLKLWHRQCQCAGGKSENGVYQNTVSHSHGQNHCPNEFETSYAPERKEIVYCEQCYNSEVV